jgi:hypothetical protein
MAVMTSDELVEIRRECAVGETVTWDKATINIALQAIEDWFEANKADLVGAINTATSPFVFSNPQKKKLIAYWLKQKFRRENV